MSTPDIDALIERGALFVINHSGGKDSQTMCLMLERMVPRNQLVIVHADLGEVEWEGAQEHIKATSTLPLHVTRSRRTLLQMIEERGMFPSPQQRQCTSDLKRGPIERTIREITRIRKEKGQRSWGLIVNCMGMRAQESPGRAKLKTFKLNPGNSKAGREWYDWLPIHDWTTDQVFAYIKECGQEPHSVYAQGMTRFSCCFCIMASEHDLRTAAKLNPSLYRRYVDLEKSTGQTMLMPKNGVKRGLEEVTGIPAI